MHNVLLAIFSVTLLAGDADDPLIGLIRQFNEGYQRRPTSTVPGEEEAGRSAWIERFESAVRLNDASDYLGEAEFILGKLYLTSGNIETALSHFDRVILDPSAAPTLKYLASDIAMHASVNAELPIDRVRHFFEHYAENLPQVRVLETDEESKRMIAYDTFRLSLTQAELFERAGAYTEAIGAYTAHLEKLENSPEAAELADVITQRHEGVESILYNLVSLYLFLAETAESGADFNEGHTWRTKSDTILWRLLDEFPPPKLRSRRGVAQSVVPWEPVAQLLENARVRDGVGAAYIELAERISGLSQENTEMVVLELFNTGCGDADKPADPSTCDQIASLAERLMIEAYPDDYGFRPVYHEALFNRLRAAMKNKADKDVTDLISQLSAMSLSDDAAQRLISYQESYLRQDSLQELLPRALGTFAEAIKDVAVEQGSDAGPEPTPGASSIPKMVVPTEREFPVALALIAVGVCLLGSGAVLYLLRRGRQSGRNGAGG